jgi:hypothetical protein
VTAAACTQAALVDACYASTARLNIKIGTSAAAISTTTATTATTATYQWFGWFAVTVASVIVTHFYLSKTATILTKRASGSPAANKAAATNTAATATATSDDKQLFAKHTDSSAGTAPSATATGFACNRRCPFEPFCWNAPKPTIRQATILTTNTDKDFQWFTGIDLNIRYSGSTISAVIE